MSQTRDIPDVIARLNNRLNVLTAKYASLGKSHLVSQSISVTLLTLNASACSYGSTHFAKHPGLSILFPSAHKPALTEEELSEFGHIYLPQTVDMDESIVIWIRWF